MDSYQELNVVNVPNNKSGKSGYSIASLVLSAAPIIILLLGFLFCLIVSGGSTSENDMGAVWWLFLFLILIIVPVAIATNILSIIFGIIGLKRKKTIFSWAGIAIVILEIVAILSVVGIVTIINMSAKNARNQEIAQQREEIMNYETYADLTPFGLGIYKLRCEGDRYLWDITKPSKYAIDYDGVCRVFDVHYNQNESTGWDDAWGGNSNAGKNVTYDVILYEDIYLIVAPLWEQPLITIPSDLYVVSYFWGYIYLCKEINEDADLFDIGVIDKKVVDKILELPGEKLSRKELSERLGKAF